MLRSVSAALEFIEGPMVMAQRGMAVEDVTEFLKESRDSGTLVDLGVAPNALLRKALDAPLYGPSGESVMSTEAWLSVSWRCGCAKHFASHHESRLW